VDTGLIQDVENATLFGPEGAWVNGPFSVYGEYNDARIKRGAGEPDLNFESWHVAATWSLTGESRASIYRLDAGEFKRIQPAQPFRRGAGPGAWELALRYASIDLNDGSFIGGAEETLSMSANWYLNNNIRMIFDWTHIVDTDESNQVRIGAVGMDIFWARAQFTF
jgi:phosphate-selective porin OprO/OprP